MATKKKPQPKKSTLRELFIQKLQAIYDSENQIVKALPKMVSAATDIHLKEGFAHHLEETRAQITRLEEAFEILGEKPKKLKVEATRGLVLDGEWVVKNVKKGEALDTNLAAAARSVEHYEIASYLGAIAWAKQLDENEVASLLEENLSEEEETDQELEKTSNSLLKKVQLE